MACWIRGCEIKGGKHVSKKRSFFTPRTEKMLNNWQNSETITKGINNLSKASRICELHFMEKNILREDIFEMADGSFVTIPRKIPKLMEDAIPCNFPPEKISFCCVNSIYEEKRKEQLREPSVAISHSIIDSSISVPETYGSYDLTFVSAHNSSPNRNNNELQTWTAFIDKLKSLNLPSEFWTPIITAESAMWVCWKTDLSSCVRRIVLKKNMTFCVFIGERKIDCLGGKVNDIHQIQSLLKKISDVYPCKEIGNETCSSFCYGYVTRDCIVRGMRRDRCISCAKYMKNRVQRSLKKPIENKKLVKSDAALRMKCKNIFRSNTRLRQKVEFT